MGQERSTPRLKTSRHGEHQQPKTICFIEHEGLLKLRKTPFKNSIRISDSPPLFLQNITTTLTSLLAERMGGKRLFTEQNLIELAETCLYTLTYLESNHIVYKDLCADHIYYDAEGGAFKLLPVELISESSYQLVLKGKKFRSLAPEMILALRMEEDELQEQILQRSNVFILGMLLLEVCSLRPSSECYDDDNFDILDKAIQERLDMVRQNYPLKIAELLEGMLEYDYTRRLGLEQLAFLVNEAVTLERTKRNQLSRLRKPTTKPKEVEQVPRFCNSPLAIKVKQNPHPRQEALQNITNRKVIYNQPPTIQEFTPPTKSHYQQPNPYQYNQQFTPPAHFRMSTQSQSSHQKKSQNREHSYLVNPKNANRQFGVSTFQNETETTLSPRRQTMGGRKYPSIIYQADFSTQRKDEKSELWFRRPREQVQRSSRRTHQFTRMEPVGRFGP